jgi:hypothetical protein
MWNRLSQLAEAEANLPTPVQIGCYQLLDNMATYLDVVRSYCSALEAMLEMYCYTMADKST